MFRNKIFKLNSNFFYHLGLEKQEVVGSVAHETPEVTRHNWVKIEPQLSHDLVIKQSLR